LLYCFAEVLITVTLLTVLPLLAATVAPDVESEADLTIAAFNSAFALLTLAVPVATILPVIGVGDDIGVLDVIFPVTCALVWLPLIGGKSLFK
jgi:hypothetical protein